ncbi:uncharacterized protein LOC103662638 isoform X6 [Ursus maritimus]|uniref:Uncharacterized protein LOC103662638 isoform X6 n=1 Tax=Ursus maritimus TaxID=29073 RepID=A0A384C113_URSMA|nr:uncharacterized protein LOC103662638 isoform X6 [Ursus maritimus]
MSLIPSAAWEAWAGGAEGQGGAASEAPGLGIPWSTSWGEDPLLGFGTLELSVSMSRGRGASGRGACGDGEGSAERAVQEPVWEKHSQGLPAFSCEQVRVTSSLCLQQRLIDSSRVKPSPRDARVLRPLLCPVSDPSPDMSPQSQRVPNLGMKEATEHVPLAELGSWKGGGGRGGHGGGEPVRVPQNTDLRMLLFGRTQPALVRGSPAGAHPRAQSG